MPKKGVKAKVGWWNKRMPLFVFWPLIIAVITGVFFCTYSLFSRIEDNRVERVAATGEPLSVAENEIGYYTAAHSVATADSAVTLVPPRNDVAVVSSDTFLPPAEQPLLSGRISSFGDNFSGLGYIDRQETDMFWDENVTAFSFPPLFALEKQNDCSEPFCGLALQAVDPESVCLPAGCLRKAGGKLYFKEKELKLPPAVAKETVNSITLAAIDDFWLIGLVTGPSVSERGWVYRFDGLAFSPLITDTTDYQILPRYERGGGRVAFGGSADDFIVAYTGYDGYAFRFRQGKAENISDYLGLRVTAGGFLAQIIKAGSNFYICSVSEGKPKVIKIWSKDEKTSGGAIELSPLLFGKDLSPQRIICALSDEKQQKLAIASQQNSSFALYSFQDRGFDNTRGRKITSVNLNRQDKEVVQAAVFADMGLVTRDPFPGNGAVSYLANVKEKFEVAAPYLWHRFEETGSELYWRLEIAASPDADYSPWLGHINRLDYMFQD